MNLSYVISTITSNFSLFVDITECFDFLSILSATLFPTKLTVASAVSFKCFYQSCFKCIYSIFGCGVKELLTEFAI